MGTFGRQHADAVNQDSGQERPFQGFLVTLTLLILALPQLLSEARLHDPLSPASCTAPEPVLCGKHSQDDSLRESSGAILDLVVNHHREGWPICVLSCK